MIYDRNKLTDRILIEEHTGLPHTIYSHLAGYPDESRWYVFSGPAYVEDGVLVLDDESPACGIRRVDEDAEAEAFLAELSDADPWSETTTWRWESGRED